MTEPIVELRQHPAGHFVRRSHLHVRLKPGRMVKIVYPRWESYGRITKLNTHAYQAQFLVGGASVDLGANDCVIFVELNINDTRIQDAFLVKDELEQR